MDQALPERIEDGDLVLRRWTPEDLEVMAELVARNVAHLRPRMPWAAGEPMALDDRRALLEEWDRAWRTGGDLFCGIFFAGEAVGSCGLHHRVGPRALEVGYWVDAAHQGRGLATRAAAMLTDLAFTRPDVDVVVIVHDETNRASEQVPRKLGFAEVARRASDREQAEADTGIDVVWQVARAEWSAQRPHRS